RLGPARAERAGRRDRRGGDLHGQLLQRVASLRRPHRDAQAARRDLLAGLLLELRLRLGLGDRARVLRALLGAPPQLRALALPLADALLELADLAAQVARRLRVRGLRGALLRARRRLRLLLGGLRLQRRE